MTKTQQGGDKPLIFNENRDRFKEYEDKIIYISPEDVIIISDVDEFPNLKYIKMIRDSEGCSHSHGGWHLTYFGGVERVRTKFSSTIEGKTFQRWDKIEGNIKSGWVITMLSLNVLLKNRLIWKIEVWIWRVSVI